MKTQTLVCLGLFIAGIAVVLLQLWGNVWSETTFIKIIITNALLFVVAIVVAFVLRETAAGKKTDNEHELD